MEQGVASTRHKDRLFDFNMIDRSKSNFRKSGKNRFSESRFNRSSKNRLKIDITRRAKSVENWLVYNIKKKKKVVCQTSDGKYRYNEVSILRGQLLISIDPIT